MSTVIRTIWPGNGFGLVLTVEDPWTIIAQVVREKDPTDAQPDTKAVAVESFFRRAELDEDEELIEGSEETLSAFVERALGEVQDWFETTLAELKETDELADLVAQAVAEIESK